MLGVFCSERCPSFIVLDALDVASAIRDADLSVISGFQSPVERECLGVFLRGSAHVVVCPARSAIGMRIPSAWKPAIAAGILSIRSAIDEGFEANSGAVHHRQAPRRPTTALAEHRNRFVASISDSVLVIHASPGGKLERLVQQLLAQGKPVWTLDHPDNAHLIGRGARQLGTSDPSAVWRPLGDNG